MSTRTYIFTVCRLSGHTIWFRTYRKYTTLALLILSTQGTFSFPLGNSKTGSVDTRDIAAMAALFDYKDSENSWLATLEYIDGISYNRHFKGENWWFDSVHLDYWVCPRLGSWRSSDIRRMVQLMLEFLLSVRGTPITCQPRAKRAPFRIQCIACTLSAVKEPFEFTSCSHDWTRITETALHIPDQSALLSCEGCGVYLGLYLSQFEWRYKHNIALARNGFHIYATMRNLDKSKAIVELTRLEDT